MRIRAFGEGDRAAILRIINEAAQAYRGVIPADRWHEPYMPAAELAQEIASGVMFWVAEAKDRIAGVMGIQDRDDVALVRHAYVAPGSQRSGVGTKLLRHLMALSSKPLLVGTWAEASWAIDFYRRNGFTLLEKPEKERLLRKYWSIPQRQIETSVVLADKRWMASGIAIRPAPKSACRRIAELYEVSSEGLAKYLWSKLALPGEDLLEAGRRHFEGEGTDFSYRNCKLAERDGAVVGMRVAFPMKVGPGYREADPVLAPYSVLEEDRSYYICGIAVDEAHRGGGIGSALLADAEHAARSLGFRKTSLIVFEQNARAKRLYERYGYVEKLRHAVVPHPLIRCTGDALLMVKQLG